MSFPALAGLAALTVALAQIFGAPASAGQAACTPDFPLKDGWLGGDGVYSVPLSDTDSLWLFGDSFVGDPDTQNRKDAALVSNSIALSRCTGGAWSITYHWEQRGPAHRAFFDPQDADAQSGQAPGAVRYWPLEGLLRDGILTLFMMRVETVEAGNPFGFAITGTDLIRIGNPTAPPHAWDMRIHPVGRRAALTGSGLVTGGDHLILATSLEKAGSHPVILTRLPFDRLDDPGTALETLTGPKVWTRGLDLEKGRKVVDQASSELSLHRLPDDRRLLMVHMDPEPFSSRIVHRTAPAVEGPWSPMRPLFTIPDARTRGTGTVFCYAGKAHGQFDRTDGDGPSVLLTYACNSTDFTQLLENTDLYRPKTVRIPLPAPQAKPQATR